jgi:hydroxymethylpyrimidine pyrophosphatase-like HAD family hydrolase
MRYLALATDYDGTIARDGTVDAPTLAALERVLGSGRKLILVTGREMDDLKRTFAHLHLFEWVVAENGAQLYRPSDQCSMLLAEPPPARFVEELKRRGVGPISVGGVIVATWHPHETAVLETIRDLGLELHVVFNKDAVMVLPATVNKATGLKAALKRLGLSAHNVVGVGDAENDHAFMALCECSAAVANALPAVKETADLTLKGRHGAGVAELIDMLITNDLAAMDGRLARHRLLLGTATGGTDEWIKPYGTSLLIAGPSGSGKSTVATGLLERLREQKYQFCIIDPEGDYEGFEGAIVLGAGHRPPTVDEVVQLLKDPRHDAVVNLIGLPLNDRPSFFLTLLTRLLDLRAGTGRPHWLVVDEAHHLLPTSWQPAALALPQQLNQLLLLTVHPAAVSADVLGLVDTVVAVGADPGQTLSEFCSATGVTRPPVDGLEPADDAVIVWRKGGGKPRVVKPAPSHIERRRHIRKYAEGELPPDRSFYFRGPAGKLNLRAQNLLLFMQLADGVDDETWQYHLGRGEYSDWFRRAIKDGELADEAAAVEKGRDLSAAESRARIKAAIEKRYTLPASPHLPLPGTDAAPRWS